MVEVGEIMKKRFIIIVVIALVCITIFVLLNKTTNTANDVDSIQKYVTSYVDGKFLNKNVTKKDLKGYTGEDLLAGLIFYGKDSYTRLRISDDLIKKNKLESYSSLQNKYASNVEEKLLSNFVYGYNNYTEKDGVSSLEIEYRTFYYNFYVSDLVYLTDKILVKNGNNTEKIDYSSPIRYKAKVMAMKVLDSHLDDYVNSSESRIFTIDFKNGMPEEGEMFSLYLNLGGNLYNQWEDRESTLNLYLDKAISSGVLNKNNILKI